MVAPSANGANGRDASGKFATGNRGGPGNPHAKQVAKLRKALLDTVTAEDVAEVVRALVAQAKNGDVVAAREVLDRTIGKALELDVIARLDDLEGVLAEAKRW